MGILVSPSSGPQGDRRSVDIVASGQANDGTGIQVIQDKVTRAGPTYASRDEMMARWFAFNPIEQIAREMGANQRQAYWMGFGAMVVGNPRQAFANGIKGAATGAESALQAAMLRMQLKAEEVAGAQLPSELTGYTKHGLNQAISRDGVGVAPGAILDAFNNPLSISGQSGGRFMMTGKDAVIVVNDLGKIITTWATNSAGVRMP